MWLSAPERLRERVREKKDREKDRENRARGDHGKGEDPPSQRFPRLTILFTSPPIYSALSHALHPPLKNPREPLRRREPPSGIELGVVDCRSDGLTTLLLRHPR